MLLVVDLSFAPGQLGVGCRDDSFMAGVIRQVADMTWVPWFGTKVTSEQAVSFKCVQFILNYFYREL